MKFPEQNEISEHAKTLLSDYWKPNDGGMCPSCGRVTKDATKHSLECFDIRVDAYYKLFCEWNSEKCEDYDYLELAEKSARSFLK